MAALFTYVQDDVVHAELRLLLQPSQRLRVLVAQVAIQRKLGAEAGAVVESGEEEDVAPALVAATVVGWKQTGQTGLFISEPCTEIVAILKLRPP